MDRFSPLENHGKNTTGNDMFKLFSKRNYALSITSCCFFAIAFSYNDSLLKYLFLAIGAILFASVFALAIRKNRWQVFPAIMAYLPIFWSPAVESSWMGALLLTIILSPLGCWVGEIWANSDRQRKEGWWGGVISMMAILLFPIGLSLWLGYTAG